jgi:hypothetical protein
MQETRWAARVQERAGIVHASLGRHCFVETAQNEVDLTKEPVPLATGT